MPKAVANPVEVDYYVIRDTRQVGELPEVFTDELGWLAIPPGGTARYRPVVGDYYVVQQDGYVYLNPKDVFERKYRPLAQHLAQQMTDPKVPSQDSATTILTESSLATPSLAPASDPGTDAIRVSADSASKQAKSA